MTPYHKNGRNPQAAKAGHHGGHTSPGAVTHCWPRQCSVDSYVIKGFGNILKPRRWRTLRPSGVLLDIYLRSSQKPWFADRDMQGRKHRGVLCQKDKPEVTVQMPVRNG